MVDLFYFMLVGDTSFIVVTVFTAVAGIILSVNMLTIAKLFTFLLITGGENNKGKKQTNIIPVALSFTLGFAFILGTSPLWSMGTSLGASAAALWGKGLGITFILFGASLMGVIAMIKAFGSLILPIRVIGFHTKQGQSKWLNKSLIKAVLMGGLFGFAPFLYQNPVVLVLLTTAISNGGLLTACFLLFILGIFNCTGLLLLAVLLQIFQYGRGVKLFSAKSRVALGVVALLWGFVLLTIA
ncbi:hypothetical protein GGQ84_000104 [Desulfitispora alkaliphila]|uniref:hypothetical protein n=1 Tax=Desulfitispora alkaliphila TaxID=622674 RepID=UPI003D238A91